MAAVAQPFVPRDLLSEPAGAGWNFASATQRVFDVGGTYRPDVKYTSVGTVPSLYLFEEARTGWVFPILDPNDAANDAILRLDWSFVGEPVHNPEPLLWDPIGMKYNFYETYTPDGITGVAAGKRVIYESVYDSIDYHVLSNKSGPKFLIVVRPGGDPSNIMLKFEGQDSIKVDVDGALKLIKGTSFIKLREGIAYQQVGNTIVPVSWTPEYEHYGTSVLVTLSLGEYDPTLPLILRITPEVPPAPPPPDGEYTALPEWSTYLAGAGADDQVSDLDFDGNTNGYVYYTGNSRSVVELPIFGGSITQPFLSGTAQDVIIGRFNSHYEMEIEGCWMSYFGAAGKDRGRSIAYDKVTERITICGHSESNPALLHLPMGSSWQWTGHGLLSSFASATGVLVFSTRLMHTNTNLWESDPKAIDYDADGNLYLVGIGHYSNVHPDVDMPGTQDFFQHIPVPADPNYLPDWYDGYIMRFDPDFHLTYSTTLGGRHADAALSVHADDITDHLFVVGGTWSENNLGQPDCNASATAFDFPVCDNGGYYQPKANGSGNTTGYSDGFICMFDMADMHMSWGTYFGSEADYEDVTDVYTDTQGNVYVVGYTDHELYNTTSCDWDEDDQFPGCFNGQWHMESGSPNMSYFIARFDPNTNLTWSTFVGGSADEQHELLVDSRVQVTCDEHDNVFMFGTSASGSNVGGTPMIPPTWNPTFFQQGGHADFPSTASTLPYDTYVAMFTPGGQLIYATPFGGIGNEFNGGLIARDGRLYISGGTYSNLGFPLHSPNLPGYTPYVHGASAFPSDQDGFIAQLEYNLSVGLEDARNEGGQGLIIYPNPSSTAITIALPFCAEGSQVQIYNSLGEPVISGPVNPLSSFNADVRALPSGPYLVRLSRGGTVRVGRFIKL